MVIGSETESYLHCASLLKSVRADIEPAAGCTSVNRQIYSTNTAEAQTVYGAG